jgi:phosphoglycolate phosphatase-like HAD superfamily hydrolase
MASSRAPRLTSAEVICVLFDVDGTLISSGGAGAASWRLAFDDLYGIPADIGKFTDDGMTEPDVGRLTFKAAVGHEPTKKELARVMSTRLQYLRQTVAESKAFRVLPGVERTLERLHSEGYLLGIITGGVEAAAHMKLARANLNHYFCFGGYGSDSVDRIELTRTAIARAATLLGEPLDPQETLAVGDTPRDIEAGHGAGALAAGVATGHYSTQDLRAAGADFVLGSLEEELPLNPAGHPPRSSPA